LLRCRFCVAWLLRCHYAVLCAFTHVHVFVVRVVNVHCISALRARCLRYRTRATPRISAVAVLRLRCLLLLVGCTVYPFTRGYTHYYAPLVCIPLTRYRYRLPHNCLLPTRLYHNVTTHGLTRLLVLFAFGLVRAVTHGTHTAPAVAVAAHLHARCADLPGWLRSLRCGYTYRTRFTVARTHITHLPFCHGWRYHAHTVYGLNHTHISLRLRSVPVGRTFTRPPRLPAVAHIHLPAHIRLPTCPGSYMQFLPTLLPLRSYRTTHAFVWVLGLLMPLLVGWITVYRTH